MGWLNKFKKTSSNEVAGAARSVRSERESNPPAYGTNPYDTYTWELHTDPETDHERRLKRAHVIDKPKPDGETFNPYDTGKFSGGW